MITLAAEQTLIKTDVLIDLRVDERGRVIFERTMLDFYDDDETQESDTYEDEIGHIDDLTKWDVPSDLADRLSELQHEAWAKEVRA